MAFPAFWESKMFDFTACDQTLANSLFVETPELEKYLKENWYPDEGGGGGAQPP